TGADRERIGRFAQDSLAAGLPFDAFFDRSDASKVYCSEFTALALASGGVPPRSTAPMSANESVRVILGWLHITTPDIIPPSAVIEDATRVAMVSRRYLPAQIEAYFAVRAELHRRFTPDQKLGNVLRFSPTGGFRFQPAVEALLRSANAAAADWGGLSPDDIEQRVRALAAGQMGPFAPQPLAGRPEESARTRDP
ncbi:MAG: hypothetical protein ABIX37_10360, partial [Gammaproteobacteria bacterium]